MYIHTFFKLLSDYYIIQIKNTI